MALVSTTCPECHASIKLDDSKPFGFCLSCGSKIAIATLFNPQEKQKGTSESIKNYLSLATSAKKAGNNEQCEMYCNKVIEIDGASSEAWALKASAAGWQSSLANLRIQEMITYYGNAVKYAPTEEAKKAVRELASSDLTNITTALFKVQTDRFLKWTDSEEAAAFQTAYMYIISCGISYIQNLGSTEFGPIEVCQVVALLVKAAAENAEKVVKANFLHANSGYPSDYDWETMINKMSACYDVYTTAALMANKDYDLKIKCYEAMIDNLTWTMKTQSFKSEYNSYSERFEKVPSLTLSNSARSQRQQLISTCKSEIEKAKREDAAEKERVRKERNEKYWKEHADDKKKLLSEREGLEKEVKTLTGQLADIDKMEDVVDLNDELETLQLERKALGIFKMKEKKAIDAKIADCKSKLDGLSHQRKDPIQGQLDAKKKRIDWINNELTRDR